MADKPLLDLSTLERPTISIDKRPYDLMRPEDFGLRESVRIEHLRASVARAMGTGFDLTDDASMLAIAEALDTLTRIIIPDLPPEVFARLRDGQKLKVVEAFSGLAAPRDRVTPMAEIPSTGANGSRG